MKKFTTRYENSYNLKCNERYNEWLKVYYPERYSTINRQSGTYNIYINVKSNYQKLAS